MAPGLPPLFDEARFNAKEICVFQKDVEEVQARKDCESAMEQRLADMRRAIEGKQREVESLSNKI